MRPAGDAIRGVGDCACDATKGGGGGLCICVCGGGGGGEYDAGGAAVFASEGGSIKLAMDGDADARFTWGDTWAEGVLLGAAVDRARAAVSIEAARTGSYPRIGS